MAPIVAPNVLQISMLGRWTNGEPVVSVLHFHVDGELGDPDLESEVEDVVQNWQSQLMPGFRNNYTLEGARWMWLASLDGETGFVPPQEGEPVVGGSTGESTNPQNSILVRKNIVGTRTSRAGRMYLPPPGEGDIDEDGRLSGSLITALNADLANFLANTTQGGLGEDTNRYMTVLHQDGSNTRVTSLTVDPVIASQRRRQR